MSKALLTYLENDDEMRDRFVERAFQENPHISNFEEFSTALTKAFSTSNGQKALKGINDDETRFLFKSSETQMRLSTHMEDNEIENAETQSEYFEVQRDVAKGQPTARKDIHVVSIDNGQWNRKQTEFIKVRKKKGIEPIHVISEYNKHFKENQRSEDSIRSKYYSI